MYGELLQFGGIQSVPEIGGGESLDFVEITAGAGAGSEETAPPVTLPAAVAEVTAIEPVRKAPLPLPGITVFWDSGKIPVFRTSVSAVEGSADAAVELLPAAAAEVDFSITAGVVSSPDETDLETEYIYRNDTEKNAAASVSVSRFKNADNDSCVVYGISGLTWSNFSSGYDGSFYQNSLIADAEKCSFTSEDDQMCWAATAANMIYYAGWGDIYASGNNEDSVFTLFRECFAYGEAYGANEKYAVEWYLTGKHLPDTWSEWDHSLDNTGGYFSGKVTSSNLSNYLSSQTVSAAAFTNAVNKLSSGYAVGLGIGYYSGSTRTNGHALTVWGVVCDTALSVTDPEYYKGIILSDSDDDKRNYADPLKAPDTIKVISLTYSSGQYYMPDYSTSCRLEKFTYLAPNTSGFTPVNPWSGARVYTNEDMKTSAATINYVTVNDTTSNIFHIHRNGRANYATVNSGGSMYVFSGGVASRTEVNPGGSMGIASGGTAWQVTENGGWVNSSAGATLSIAANTFSGNVADSASLHSGTVASGVKLYGEMHAFYRGSAQGCIVSSGGKLHISSGGTASDCVISSGGKLYVSNGGTAAHNVVSKGGTAYVSSGGFASRITIYSSGRTYISQGGSAIAMVVNPSGNLYVSSGGTATVIAHPWLGNVYSSGGASVTYLSNTHYWCYGNNISGLLSSGYTANGLNIAYGQSAVVSRYGRISNGVVSNGGFMYISSGGSARDTAVYGRMYIYSGGSHYGSMNLGSAAQVYVSSGGIIELSLAGRTSASTTIINDISCIAGTPGFNLVVSANQAHGTYKLAGGAQSFNKNITIGSEILNINGGAVNYNNSSYKLVRNNGVLSVVIGDIDNTPPDAPVVTLSETGFTRESILVKADFSSDSVIREYKYEGGSWLNYYDSGFWVSLNQTISFRAVDEAGNERLHHVVISNIDQVPPKMKVDYLDVLHGGEVITVDFDDAVSKQYCIDGEKWYDYTGELQMVKNASILFKGVDAAGNSSTLYANSVISGSASNTVNNSVTWRNVSRNDTTVTSTGRLTLASGGRTSSTLLHQGALLNVSSGGRADVTHIFSGGKMFVSSGGKANYTTIHSGGYAYNVGGSMLGVTLKNGGRAYISKGSVADTLYISQGGNAYVWSGGTAKNAYTQSFGCLYVYDGGVASGTKLMTNGNLYIYSGGKAFDTVTSYGVRINMFGGTMSKLNMQRGTIVSAYKGANVVSTTVDYGSYLMFGYSGNNCTGVASATNTTVLGGGGLTVITGAKATDITLAVNGTLTCNNNATIGGMITNAGRMNLAGNAIIADNSNIIFDLAGKSASAMVESYKEAMLNSYYVARNANMLITVSASQGAGDYILANWAGSAKGKFISLTVGSTKAGYLSVGNSLNYNGKKYSLYCFDDATNSKALTLKIEPLAAGASGIMDDPETLPDLSMPEFSANTCVSELSAESLCLDSCAPAIAAAPTLDDLFAKTTQQLPLLAV